MNASDTPPTQVGGFLTTLKSALQPLDQRSNLLWNSLLRGICFVFCTLSSPDKSLVFSECLQNKMLNIAKESTIHAKTAV